MKSVVRIALAVVLCSVSESESSPGVDLGSMLDHLLAVYTPVSGELGPSLCRAQGLLYKQAVKDGQDWALNMLDASSKLPSGVLTGNLVQLGSYDQCLSVRHWSTSHGLIVGQHCMVAIGIDNVFTRTAMAAKYDAYSVYHKQRAMVAALLEVGETAEAFSKMGATLSICLPASCTPADLELHLRSSLRVWLGDAVNVTVNEHACNSNADAPPALKATTVLAVITILVVVTLVLFGTAYDLLNKTEQRNALVLAFSASASFKALTKTSKDAVSMPVLDGIRVLSILWVLLLHHYLFSLIDPIVNYHSFLEIETDWRHLLISNGTFCVDSFLLLAGTLLAFNFLADRKKGLPFNITKFYIRRYIRITPSMVAVSLLVSILQTSAGDGPFVKTSSSQMRDNCDNAWWLSLLYVTNYVPKYFECVNVNWYLSLDMQLVLISPLVLVPLSRRPRVGRCLTVALLVAGIATVFAIAYSNQFTINKHLTEVGERLRQEEILYLPTHARFTPWVIGLLLGQTLHETANTSPKLSKTLITFGWLASILLMASALLPAHHFFQGDEPYDKMATALYVAYMRPAWALALAFVVFACTRGYGGFLNDFLSWRGFVVPSRLSFAVFLCHWTVISGFHATRKHPRHFDDVSMVIEYLGLTLFSFGAAFVLHIFFEAPATVVGKLILGKFGGCESSNVQQKTAERPDGGELKAKQTRLLGLKNSRKKVT